MVPSAVLHEASELFRVLLCTSELSALLLEFEAMSEIASGPSFALAHERHSFLNCFVAFFAQVIDEPVCGFAVHSFGLLASTLAQLSEDVMPALFGFATFEFLVGFSHVWFCHLDKSVHALGVLSVKRPSSFNCSVGMSAQVTDEAVRGPAVHSLGLLVPFLAQFSDDVMPTLFGSAALEFFVGFFHFMFCLPQKSAQALGELSSV